MKEHCFEIVRRGDDRYSWLFVVVDGRRQRVLARSARTYRSPQKAVGAINKLRAASTICEPDEPFSLPETSFRIVSGVVPLVVREFPVEDDSQDVQNAAPVAAKPAPKPAAARAARKPAARRGARAKKAT